MISHAFVTNVSSSMMGDHHVDKDGDNNVDKDGDHCVVTYSPQQITTINEEDQTTARGNWTGKLDFLLSCLSYAVGLGNVWRFPYLCYSNGGGAFLIPYWIMLIIAGLPLFFMELSFGQYASEGPISIWKVSPLFKGVGYGMFIISFLIGIYYNMVIAWAVYYIAASFTLNLPWSGCENDWNTNNCSRFVDALKVCNENDGHDINGTCYVSNMTQDLVPINLTTLLTNITTDKVDGYISNGIIKFLNLTNFLAQKRLPSDEYFHRHVLSLTDGLDEMGGVKWELALCLLFSWVLVVICLGWGVRSSGKAAYFTATFPYLVLLVLLCRGLTLEGSLNGITFYLRPQWHRLLTPKVWGDAAVQIFFSLSPCWGGLIALASYNKFHNNCFRDALVVSLGNCITSVLAGFVIFSIIGYMAHQLGVPVSEVARKGAGLAFVVYPEAMAQLPGAPIWSVLFFAMLITLGLGTQFTVVTTVVTTIVDEWPDRLRPYRLAVLITVCAVSYLIGLTFCSHGGMYAVQLFDSYAASWSVLIIGFVECVALSWVYGVDKLLLNIQVMLGRRVPGYNFWYFMWKFGTPLVLALIMIFTWLDFTPASYGEYKFPAWADAVGWVMSFSSVLLIPIVASYFIASRATGSLWQRVKYLSQPTPAWGPALEEHRAEAVKLCGFPRYSTSLPDDITCKEKNTNNMVTSM